MFRDTVGFLFSSIEAKDVHTGEHSLRVRALAVGLAEYMGLDQGQLRSIEAAAVLHDIGKIVLSSDLLTKPGKLTEEEYGQVKEHPQYSKMILDCKEGFSEVADIAYQHHECFDGSGYPRGLGEGGIMIEAAILALVDAFDAMTSDRPYRPGTTRDEAFSILRNERGRQFHPLVVDSFLNWQNADIEKMRRARGTMASKAKWHSSLQFSSN